MNAAALESRHGTSQAGSVARAGMLALIVAVAVTVSSASLRNGFTYDDVPIVEQNANVTSLRAPAEYFARPYWPIGGLYRPLTVWSMAALWRIGGGTPFAFHLVNVGLNAVVALLVFALARQFAPAGAALVAGLLFAVHPVHSEAVANVVGLSELLCATFVLLAVLMAASLARGRQRRWTSLAMVALGMLAALSKEQGFITPLLVLVVGIAVGGRAALPRLAPTVLAMTSVLAALLAVRAGVLGGLAGDEAAAPLRGLAMGDRALVALGTVPSWTRLLLWPAALHFDYSPPGYPLLDHWSLTHFVGLLLLGTIGWIGWRLRDRATMVGLGIGWAAVAILPVSNILLPSGILLAERTLYLASVGAVLAVTGVLMLLRTWLPAGAPRRVAAPLVAGVVALAGWHHASRMPVWRSNAHLFAQVDREAARNYRAHKSWGIYLDREGMLADAEREYRRSIALWPHDPEVAENLAMLLDRQERDQDAVSVLETALATNPGSPLMRSKLYYLQATGGDWAKARETAAAGVALGDTIFTALVRRADSGLAVAQAGAP